jgi:branched-chain amino acid transport system ATP-binding protein
VCSRPRLTYYSSTRSLGLAPIIVQRLLRVIRDAVTGRGLAVVLVEQHINSALDFSDRAIVLRRGQVALAGPSSELASRREEIAAHYL